MAKKKSAGSAEIQKHLTSGKKGKTARPLSWAGKSKQPVYLKKPNQKPFPVRGPKR